LVVSVDEGLLGLELEELLPLLDWSLEPDELGVDDEELEELGELGVDAPDELDELGELGLLEESRLELEPDIEPDGEDGEVPEAPLEDPERDAPGPLALSQP
jgi:hypothetical protein